MAEDDGRLIMKKIIQAILNFIGGDELEHLDIALCAGYRKGKFSAEDISSYNRHAYECKQAGVERKTWPEFFGRTIEPTGYNWNTHSF